MDIKDVITAKHQLEGNLRRTIDEQVRSFTSTTGVCPSDISVETVRHEIVGQAGVECRVANVRVEIRL